jgi:hypothetical protein
MTTPTAGNPPNSDNTDYKADVDAVVLTTRLNGLKHAKSVATSNGDTDRATALQAEIDALS